MITQFSINNTKCITEFPVSTYFITQGVFMSKQNSTTRETTANRLVSYLRTLSNRRSSGVVTADDAQNYLSRNGISAKARTRLSFINSVLRSPMFETVGTTYSTRPVAKSRAISTWRSV